VIENNRWIVRPNPNNNAKLRLFCFPYAGSSAVVTYKFLVDNLPEFIDVCPVELPGRGARMMETLIDNLDVVIDEATEAIQDFIDIPFIFFGHSMGALISYELTHSLIQKYSAKPSKLYMSAHKAPFLERSGPIMHKLEANKFTDELVKMDGISKEIMQHKELMELVLPIIRNDYLVCETYKYKQKELLDIPITVFGGSYDKDITENDLLAWSKITSADFNHFMIQGDHFFILKQKDYFLKLFSRILTTDLSKIINNI